MTGTIAPVRPDRGAARDSVSPGASADVFAPPLEPSPSLCVLMERWAAETPDRTFLAERSGAPAGEPWRTLRYGEARTRARGVAQALLDRGLEPERPILILAENGIDHAVVMLGAMLAGVPVAPVSTAYARLSRDFAKLRYVVDMVRPQLVYVDDPARYGDALRAVDLGDAEVVTSRPSPDFRATPLSDLESKH